MKRQFIRDLNVKTVVSDIFYISGREVKDRRDGGHFMKLELSDKTGSVGAVVWDNVTELLEAAQAGQFVRVNGTVGEYGGKLQLTVSHLAPVKESEVNRADFIRSSEYPIDKMYEELLGFFAEVANPHLRALLDVVFADPDFADQFRSAPGGARVHHAYSGGLLEHTLFMLRASRSIRTTYPQVDYPLLVAGIILHDIGKIDEYEYKNAIDHTLDGRLIGHLVQGYKRADAAIQRVPGFPDELRRMVLHIILSHHGEMEFGSPKTPKFVEAYLVHMFDHIDAWVAMFREIVASNPGTQWTEYHNFLETNVYIPDKPVNDA